MTVQRVEPKDIEGIVGVLRHPTDHYGLASSQQRTVYVMHSAKCVGSGIDLLTCRFSQALHNGIAPHSEDGAESWIGREDEGLRLRILGGRLWPYDAPGVVPEGYPGPWPTEAELAEPRTREEEDEKAQLLGFPPDWRSQGIHLEDVEESFGRR